MSTLALSSRALAGQPSWPDFGAGCLTYEITDLGGSFHTPEPQVAESSKEMEGETLNPRLHGQPGLHSSPLTVPSSCALPVGTVQNVLGFRMVLGGFSILEMLPGSGSMMVGLCGTQNIRGVMSSSSIWVGSGVTSYIQAQGTR